MNVLIVEDDFIIAEQLRSIITTHGDTVIGHADTIADAKKLIQLRPDLCFLDIYLRNGDIGIELGKVLQEKGIAFIFLTANNEMETLKKAVSTEPLNYITKPFSERDIIASLELARIRLSKTIEVKTHPGTITLKHSDILYIEADNVYVTIVTSEKSYVLRMTLKEMEGRLDDTFIRVHRSYLVNRNKISSRNSQYVFLGDIRIPYSKKEVDLKG